MRKVECRSTSSNKFSLCFSFFIKLTTCHRTNLFILRDTLDGLRFYFVMVWCLNKDDKENAIVTKTPSLKTVLVVFNFIRKSSSQSKGRLWKSNFLFLFFFIHRHKKWWNSLNIVGGHKYCCLDWCNTKFSELMLYM